MKTNTYLRFSLSLFFIITLLMPTAALASGSGKRHFREGMRYEAAEEWDKAAEAFALAVNASPRNPEYRLHLRRALFNASQMYMRRGRIAADEQDYEGAYVAFRKAYAFDPVNELAKSEMARMLRLQEDFRRRNGQDPSTGTDVGFVPTGGTAPDPTGFQIPQRLETLRDLPFPSGVNLQFIVKQLAQELDLNVLFDAELRLETRTVRIELKRVTAARALDYIFLQEGLFFQRVGPRTILVALTTRRTLLQQLVLRTFFLENANPKDIKTIIQTAIPAQQGRAQTIVLEDAPTNSITVRDTSENVALIGRLIRSLDKNRAEVVMDVAIYEVNKSDLLQFGNQIGTAGQDGTLLNLGGVGLPFARRGSTGPITDGMGFPNIDIASIALGLPISTIAALQSKSDTKLLASTQIHAFNTEESTARIGQRVPVRTAQFQTGGTGTVGGVVSDVINYEQVGLTLKFTPTVFPNQDVQVKMSIESKDVSGASTLTPIFTERSINGTARIQNNKTLLLASVAQDVESRGRTGLPLLGLIPVLGRLFTAPTRDNRQVDIVIAITPRVIRAPAILPEDEVEMPTGSVATPTSGSLEAMIIQEERNEYLASLERNRNTTQARQREQSASVPEFVRTGVAELPAETPVSASERPDEPALRRIDSGVRPLELTQTADRVGGAQPRPEVSSDANVSSDRNEGSVEAQEEQRTGARLSMPGELPSIKAGERMLIPVSVESAEAFRSAVLGFKFDQSKLAVRSVAFGDVFGPALSGSAVQPFLNQNGKVFVSLAMPAGADEGRSGVLAMVEIEVLEDGVPAIEFEPDVLNIMGLGGKTVVIRF